MPAKSPDSTAKQDAKKDAGSGGGQQTALTELATAASGSAGYEAIIEQAAAMAVQDAVAHLRNTQTIANALLGAAGEMILRDGEAAQANEAMALAQAAVEAATMNVEKISALAVAMTGRTAGG